MSRLKKVLVVGGGTAGWLAACYLAKAMNALHPDSVQVHLVESENIGLLGVGEATFPSIRGTLAAIGLDERRFLAGATATYKQGIHYRHWVRPPGTPGSDHFFHPFSQPSQRPGGPELLPYWLLGAAPVGMPFADAVTMQSTLVDHGRGPRRLTDPDYQGPMNHAFHFDAACFARVLAEHGQQALGVQRHVATVERAVLDEQGAIACVVTKELGELTADLYVDCTGLRSALIGGIMQSPFRSRRDVGVRGCLIPSTSDVRAGGQENSASWVTVTSPRSRTPRAAALAVRFAARHAGRPTRRVAPSRWWKRR